MNADERNPGNIAKNPANDNNHGWFDPACAVAPAGKLNGTWDGMQSDGNVSRGAAYLTRSDAS